MDIRLFRVGQKDDAITVLRMNAQLYPDIAGAFDILARVYDSAQKPELARQAYKHAEELTKKEQKKSTP